MRRSIDDSRDDHPGTDDPDDKPVTSWMVQMSDDCDACEHDIRVMLTLEELGKPATGVVAHLAPAGARRLRLAIAAALKELGEDPGP